MKNFTERQKEIINVSISIIAKKGIQSLTIKNISKKIGISEPAIYRHFKNKRDIIIGILSYFSHTSELILKNIFFSENPGVKEIESIFLIRCQQFANNPSLSMLIFSEELFKNDKILSKKVLSIITMDNEVILKIIESAQKRGEVRRNIPKEQLTNIILGSLRHIITTWRLSKFSFDLINEGRQLWDSLRILISDTKIKSPQKLDKK